MSGADIVEIIGMLAGAWSLGYCGAYLITVFKKAMEYI